MGITNGNWMGMGMRTRLNLGVGMRMGMNHWEWEGTGLRKSFPLISSFNNSEQYRHLNRALKLFKRHINRTVQLKQIKMYA